jgi:hypothetical protein
MCGQIGKLLAEQQAGEPIQVTPEKYEQAMNCLAMLDSDVRALFSDYDVIRGMITGDFNLLETPTEGEPNGGDSTKKVTEESVADTQPTAGDNGEAGSDEKREERPAASRNKRRSRKKKKPVESPAAAEEVDSSSELV